MSINKLDIYKFIPIVDGDRTFKLHDNLRDGQARELEPIKVILLLEKMTAKINEIVEYLNNREKEVNDL